MHNEILLISLLMLISFVNRNFSHNKEVKNPNKYLLLYLRNKYVQLSIIQFNLYKIIQFIKKMLVKRYSRA